MTHPEKDGGGPPAECRLRTGAARFALEYTLIEPFEKHIHGATDFAAFSAPLHAGLDGTMPGPGTDAFADVEIGALKMAKNKSSMEASAIARRSLGQTLPSA